MKWASATSAPRLPAQLILTLCRAARATDPPAALHRQLAAENAPFLLARSGLLSYKVAPALRAPLSPL
jgi:hypothetical protein